MNRRIQRLNSLLKEVISDVIRAEVKNPHLPKLITITHVEVTKDLHHAKVYVSVIGDEKTRQEALNALQSAWALLESMRLSKSKYVTSQC